MYTMLIMETFTLLLDKNKYKERVLMNKKKAIITGLAISALFLPAALIIGKRAVSSSLGNDSKYDLDHTEKLPVSKLRGRKIIFLGSSVTYGAASEGDSFVEFMQKKDGIIPLKEAVSGTTLVDEEVKGKPSYISRMKTIDCNFEADCFVCQLSTNDATLKKPLGTVSDSFDMNSFDVRTVAGAIEYIIAYARKTWNCPVLFYTGTRYNSRQYEKMIELLKQIQKKWNIEVLDLWNDEEMNRVSRKDYLVYMADGIHPTKAGYREWWTPKFERKLETMIIKEEKDA